jgi:protein CpxP
MDAPFITRAAPWLLAAMLTAAPVWAQQTTPPATQPTAPTGTTHEAAPRTAAQKPGESVEALVEQRITELHSRLHITPAQSQQWDQFAQVMRDNAKQLDQLYQARAQKFATMTAVDNMQSFANIEQTRAQDVQKLVPAFQALYASLSDQQKKTADQLFRSYTAKAQTHQQAAR